MRKIALFSPIRAATLLVPALLLCAGSACTPKNYLEPDSYPRELVKTALVRTPSPVYFRNGKDLIVIKEIDRRPPTFSENKAILAPGEHHFHIGVELHRDSLSKRDDSYITRIDTSLSFDVEADHEYVINAVENEEGVWVWATDLNTGFTVAGDPPRALPKEKRIEPMWRKEARAEVPAQ